MTDAEKDIYDSLTSMPGGGPGEGDAPRSVKVYDGRSWYVTVRLSDIPGAEIAELEGADGEPPRRGLFLPFKTAGLTVTPRRHVLLVCRADMAQVASPKYTHLLTQIAGPEAVEERRRMGYRTGFIGHARPAEKKKAKGKTNTAHMTLKKKGDIYD